MLNTEDLLNYFPRYLEHIRAYQIGVSVYAVHSECAVRDISFDQFSAERLAQMNSFEMAQFRESIIYKLKNKMSYLQQAHTHWTEGYGDILSREVRYIHVPQFQTGISCGVTLQYTPLIGPPISLTDRINPFGGIPKSETLQFSLILFALNFFLQAVHAANFVLDSNKNDPADETPDIFFDKYRASRIEEALRQKGIFPFKDGTHVFSKITGILSTASTRVCPALMPLMMLYVDKVDYELEYKEWFYAARDASRERQTWVTFKPQFLIALEWALGYKKFFLEILYPNGWDIGKGTQLKGLLYREFQRLDAEIMGLTKKKSRIINF